jgi:hypothetical protein
MHPKLPDMPITHQDSNTGDLCVSGPSACQLSRRELLSRAGLALVGACAGGRALASIGQRSKSSPRHTAAEAAPNWPISGASMYQDIITYYNFGDHRTASPADSRTSDWIAAELHKAGFVTSFEPFPARQFLVDRTSLTVNGRVVASFPLWPPRAAGTDSIKAPLANYESGRPGSVRGKVALLKFPFDARASLFHGSVHFDLVNGAARAGAVAAVAVTEGPTGEIIALNSLPDLPPWPIPVLLAPGRSEAQLVDAASHSAETEFLLAGKDMPDTQARNVIGRLRSGRKIIVVSTPQSGWFRCAGERGPGIALFLGLARWVAKHQPDSAFLFVSTSGHELGQLGMDLFLREQAPDPKNVSFWLHLGAGIATWRWEQTTTGLRRVQEVDPNRLLMCSRDLPELLTPIFQDLAGLTPGIERPVGEMELLVKRGYRSFGIAAAHRYHHTPADNPEVTGPELLEPVGGALVDALQSIPAERS